MADPRRLLDDDQASRAAVQLLRTLDPPKAAPPAVRGLLAKQLAGMVATSGARAAAGISWFKLTVVSVAVVGAGSGATVWSLHRSASRSAQTPRAEVTASADVPVADRAGIETAASEGSERDPAAPVETAGARVAERPRAASAPSEPRDRLAEEEALLEEARQTLSQDPARALTLLHRHQSRYPNGELTAERMFLSVDCLSRLGKRSAAKREADALVERYPNSAYARRAPLLLTAPNR
jgi:hypothetical protein